MASERRIVNIRVISSTLVAAGLTVGISSCAPTMKCLFCPDMNLYPGPELSKSEVATLRITSQDGNFHADITSLVGPAGPLKLPEDQGNYKYFNIMPGSYQLGVKRWVFGSTYQAGKTIGNVRFPGKSEFHFRNDGWATLSFQAAPGHKYFVTFGKVNGVLAAWVKDLNTGRAVSDKVALKTP